MAIKTSNQIVFTEQKKVLDIIEWYLISDKSENVTINKETMEADGWTTKVTSTTKDKPYLWNCEEIVYSIGNSEISTPIIMRTYGKVSDIVNYYIVTSTANTPIVPDDLESSDWTSDFSTIHMSSTNKYLWNLEIIIYDDGTTNCSKPTIAGVYGDSAVIFKIYSIDGFEFRESIKEDEGLNNIKLQISALKGSEQIKNAIFTWSYYDLSGKENDTEVIDVDTEKGRWVDIDGYIDTSSTEFIVNVNQEYAFNTLRCQMAYQEYDGAEIEYFYDYVTLTKKVDIYTANIKFFTGNHVFAYEQEHIVGYVEVYKNNQIVEAPSSYMVHPCTNIDEDTGVIETDYEYPIDAEDPAYGINEIYFIYHTKEKCRIVLGKYNEVDNTWNMITPSTQYLYIANSDLSTLNNVFVVSKDNIVRSKDIDFNIYIKNLEDENSINTDALIASISTTLIDLNDTIVSDQPPNNPYDGQLWFDTEEDILKIYKLDTNGESGVWIHSSAQHMGKTVHVITPSSYKKDDLWIVEDDMVVVSYIAAQVFAETSGEYYIFEDGQYTPKTLPDDYDEHAKYYSKFTYSSGTTLKAMVSSEEFNPSHWTAVNPTLVNVQDSVTHYFKTDPKTGLRIGRISEPFYVNIDAVQMGFYVHDDLKVHIGVDSTSIKNLTVEESADFNCQVTLDKSINIVNTDPSTSASCPGFVWQIEADGGFSLICSATVVSPTIRMEV